jgi:hypothetical protein
VVSRLIFVVSGPTVEKSGNIGFIWFLPEFSGGFAPVLGPSEPSGAASMLLKEYQWTSSLTTAVFSRQPDDDVDLAIGRNVK